MGSHTDMAMNAPLELMDLPDEILLTVLRSLDYDSLLDVVYVNKHLRVLAEPFLYESITVLHGEKALNLSHSLAKDRRRAGWVRTLLVSTKFGQEQPLMKLPPSICMMDNLQDLRLETPDCNTKKPEDRRSWIALQNYYEGIFHQSSVLVSDQRTRLLPNLKTCVLHFVDTHKELYPMSSYSSIFLHPTLQSLTISCMSTDYPDTPFKDIPDISVFKRSTSLEYLHLEECDLNPSSLELLLSFPRALKSFRISEGIRYDGIFRTGTSRVHGNLKPRPFIQALVNTCKDSLETLSLALGFIRHMERDLNHRDQCLKLDELENLKHLEVNNRTLNLIRARPNCDHNTWKRLPPSLETLRVFAVPLLPPQHDGRQPYIPLQPCIIREKQLHGIPKLKKIIFSYEHYESTDDEEMNFNDLLMNLVYNEANGHPPPAPANLNHNTNLNANPILNLLQQAVGAVNPPQPQTAPPPAPTNFITAAMNPNLDAPPQNVQPPRFRWRTGPPLTRHQSRPELSRSDAAKLALLNTLHDSVLTHFIHSQTVLEIDLVKLPRGFIPPYLFPEHKPKVQEAWFTSAKPLAPDEFIARIRRKREAARMHINRHRSSYSRSDQDVYDSERERSRSRFMQRVRDGEFDEEVAVDLESDEEEVEAGLQWVLNEQNGILEQLVDVEAGDDDDDDDEDDDDDDDDDENSNGDDDDVMEVEDMLEMLVAEAQAGDEAEESDGSGSVYVDASAEVEMLNAADEHEDEEFMYLLTGANQHSTS